MDMAEHAISGGYQWQAEVCKDPRLWPSWCGTPPANKVFDTGDPIVTALPFRIYATLNCGSQGYRWQEFVDRVRTRLTAKEQQGVESAFWGTTAGDQDGWLQSNDPVTAAPNATIITGSPFTNIVTALGQLEQQIDVCYGLPAIIHVTPDAVSHLANHHLIYEKGGIYYTYRGNKVSIGAGYSGLGPAAQAIPAGGGWMYATGQVFIWRSPDILVPPPQETFNRTGNQQMLLAERDFAITAECCALAVQVTTWEGAY
jgi:hypothetical protein